MNIKLDLNKLYKDAWQHTWRNKVLWLFGIFAVGFGGGNIGNIFNIPLDSGSDVGSDMLLAGPATGEEPLAIGLIIAVIIAGVLALLVISLVIGLFSTSALLRGTVAASNNEPVKFGALLKQSPKGFWRLFGLHIVIGLAWFTLFLSWLISMALVSATVIGIIVAGLMFLAGFAAILPLSLATTMLTMFARFEIVLNKATIKQSLKTAWQLMNNHLLDAGVITLIQGVISFVIGVGIFLMAFAIVVPLVLFGIVLYDSAGAFAVIMLASISILVAIPVLAVLRGVAVTFFYSVWANAWKTFAR